MRSVDDILAAAHRELRTNSTITVYTFDGGVEHRHPVNASRGIELIQQATAWRQARRRAQRKGLRRALGALAFSPIALFLFGIYIYGTWGPDDPFEGSIFDNPVIVWSERIVGSLIMLAGIAVVIGATVSDLSAFRGDPIVMRGKIIGKTEWGETNLFGAIWRAMFGYALVVNVKKVLRIGRDGYRWDQDFRGDRQELQSTRRIHHRTKLHEEVFLVCNSGGRAVATLSDLRDDLVADELKAVFGTATPEPAPVPEPATAPQSEGVRQAL